MTRSDVLTGEPEGERIETEWAAFVCLMGLLATAAVVLISRRTELKLWRLNLALLEESRSDGLTRLANRRAWDETLQRQEGRRQRHGHRYGLVVVDLDDVKRINDQQGHLMGDQVLQTAATRMAGVLRETDLLARVGGLKGLADRFNTTGLAEVFNSWASLGENGAIKPEQIEAVLGNQAVQQFAQRLGIDTDKAAAPLSQLLPQVIDKLTPDGVLKDLDGDGKPDAAPLTNA